VGTLQRNPCDSVPGQPYDMTKRDIFRGNRDLIERCGELLATQPWTRLRVSRRKRQLTVDTIGLDQLDLYMDGHPGGTPLRLGRDGSHRVTVPASAVTVELAGFSNGVLRQRRRLVLSD
jgi:hypothetical protein